MSANNVYMIITLADRAALRSDVRALRRYRQDVMALAKQYSGPMYLRSLRAKRYIDGLILDLGF